MLFMYVIDSFEVGFLICYITILYRCYWNDDCYFSSEGICQGR